MNSFKFFLNKNFFSPLLVFILSFSYYVYCLCPGIGFGDTAILIDNIQRSVFNTEVNTHPFTILIGKIFILLPIENLAYKANLVSAFAGAIAVSIFFKAVQEYHQNYFNSILSSLVLGVSYSFFWHSTLVENYSISSIITCLSILFYVRILKLNEEKWFYPLFSLFGIGIFNHVQMGFLGMGIGVQFLIYFYKSKNKFPFFLKCSLGFILGLIPWISLFINDYFKAKNFSLVLKNAFMGSFGNIFFNQSLVVAIQEFIIIYLFQFPNLFFIFPSIGIYLMFKNKNIFFGFVGILVHFLTNSIFFAFYGTWDKFAFLLQSFILVIFFGSFFLQYLQEKSKSIQIITNILLFLSIIYGMNFYSYVNLSSKEENGFWHYMYNNDYSSNLYDQSIYVVEPNKRNFKEVEIYCDLIFEKLPLNATLLDDDSRTYYPLADYYQKYYNKRKDIQFLLMNSWGIAGWGLSSGDLISQIKQSVETNKSFFITSLSSPYTSIVNTISSDNSMYFEKFFLSEKKWIYQIKTNYKKTKNSIFQKGVWDFKIADVFSKSKEVISERQFMSNYQNSSWDNIDQIFISGRKNDFIVFSLNHYISETKNLELNLTTAPDFAIVNIYWNEKKVLENIDLFKNIVSRISLNIKKVNLLAGENKLKIEIIEKNSDSFGFKLGIDSVKILP